MTNYSEDNNPWLGFKTYQETDVRKFKGRGDDISALIRMIKSESIAVCYADSGIGKSSLINAGLCPALKKEQFFPIKILVAEDCLVAEDRQLAEVLMIDEKIINRIEQTRQVFNQEEDNKKKGITIEIRKDPSLENDFINEIDSNENVNKSLWWFLHTRVFLMNLNGLEIKLTPFLIFDQFEEIFYKAESLKQIERFFKRFREISLLTPTEEIQLAYENAIKKYKSTEVIDIPESYPLKSLFSLRREYIANLDYWTSQRMTFPSFQKNRYCLMPLTKNQAIEVITCQQTDVLNEYTDRIIQGLDPKEEAIPSILLSVVCHELYDISLKRSLAESDFIFNDRILKAYEKVVDYEDDEGHRYIDVSKIEKLEELLTNSRGKRQQISLEDSSLTQDEYEYLKNNHIIKDTEYDKRIEFVHDRLAEVAFDRVVKRTAKKIAQRNLNYNRQERINGENILSIGGREFIDNFENFGGYDDERSSMLSFIMTLHENDKKERANNDQIIKGNRAHFLEPVSLSSAETENKSDNRFVLINQSNVSDSLLFSSKHLTDLTSLTLLLKDTTSLDNHLWISFTDAEGNPCHSIDGIYEIELSITKASIIINDDFDGRETKEEKFLPEQVVFYDKHRSQKVITRNGFCGIRLKYDDKGNEIERTYLGVNSQPVMTTKCYSTVRRTYDENGLPATTLYFDQNGNPCLMWDGNHGYHSFFNNDGQEIKRIFLNIDGEPTQLKNGIYGQQYEYLNELGLQKSLILNLGFDKESLTFVNSTDIKGYCGISNEYDSKGRIQKQVFCDKNKTPKLEECGYAICGFSYDDAGQLSNIRYYDVDHSPICSNEGIYGFRVEYDEQKRPILVGFIDNLGNPTTNKNGYSFLGRKFNSIGQETEYYYLDYRRQPTYSKNGIHKSCCFYDDQKKILIKTENYDIDDNLIEDNNGCAIQKFEWDDDGRTLIRCDFFGKINSQPYFQIVFNYKDNHFVERIEKTYSGTRTALYQRDYAQRDIYYEPLDYSLDNHAHHLRFTYDNVNRRSKTLLFDEKDQPYQDDDGDYGVQKIYGPNGKEIGYSSLDEFGEKHLNKHGFSTVIWEDDPNGIVLSYFDIDGVTPVMNNTFKCHKRLLDNGEMIRSWGVDGSLCDSAMGFAFIKDWTESTDNRRVFYHGFFNSDANPVEVDGWHKVSKFESDNETILSYHNINGDLVSPYKFSIKKTENKTGLNSVASSIVRYFDENGEPVDGPNPCDSNDDTLAHKWELGGEKVLFAINTKRKRVKGSFFAQYGIVALWLITPFLFVYWIIAFSIKRVWNLIKNVKKTKRVFAETITVDEIFEKVPDLDSSINDSFTVSSACCLNGIQKGDVLLSFGKWELGYNQDSIDCNVELFEKVFNDSRNKQKLITFARQIKRKKGFKEPQITQFTAKGNIGAKITVRNDMYDIQFIQEAMNRFERTKEAFLNQDFCCDYEKSALQISHKHRSKAFVLKEMKLYEDAVSEYKEAIRLMRHLKSEQLELTQLNFELLCCYILQGKYQEAIEYTQQFIECSRQLENSDQEMFQFKQSFFTLLNNNVETEETIRNIITDIEQSPSKSDDILDFYRDSLHLYLYSLERFDEILFIAVNEGDCKINRVQVNVPYAIFEWCDWSILSNDSLKEHIIQKKKRHIVLCKLDDGEIVEFETDLDVIGVYLLSQYIDKDSKRELINRYHNWLKMKQA